MHNPEDYRHAADPSGQYVTRCGITGADVQDLIIDIGCCDDADCETAVNCPLCLATADSAKVN